ncbi:MAG TPA: BON domain-containing protein [Candidatus Binatia bacterium]|nr:BON domain-containing protein [Candidatus Binatia bacterium]
MTKPMVLGALALALGVGGAIADDRRDTAGTRAEEGRYEPDNTGKNVRDRDGKTVTPGDQGGSAGDRDLTANIRKAIVDDDNLSMAAHNVKIVTVDGVVTLRGPVKSEAEKAQVVAKAQRVTGVKRVQDQLEVDHD